MLNQVSATAMETDCAFSYACLPIEYQKNQELPKYFSIRECELIKEVFKR